MNRALILAALILGGCATTQAPAPSADGIARAGLNQRVYADGPYVTPIAVVEDSRCPVGASCAAPGRTRVMVRIDLGSRSEYRVLCSDAPLKVADGTLSLVEVQPVRAVDAQTRNYRFGMRFAGGL